MAGSLSPRSMGEFRPHTAPYPPLSQIRGGGRLYVQSPVSGLSENEMINEARIRIAHNKQRHKLKQLLATAANGGSVVSPRELELACKLAKMENVEVGLQSFNSTGFMTSNLIANRDVNGTPRGVLWDSFQKSIPYPQLHAPGDFPGQLPYTRKQLNQLKEYAELQKQQQQAVAAGEAFEAKDEVPASELIYWHSTIKRLLETRFGEIRRAYRLIDQDNSGECDRGELKHMCARCNRFSQPPDSPTALRTTALTVSLCLTPRRLNAMFNLAVPEKVMDKLIDLADYDGDGQINFAEFARLVTAEDITNLKQTLQADVSGFGTKDPKEVQLELDKHKMAELRRKQALGGFGKGYHPKLRKTGPSIDQLRHVHKALKKVINARFSSYSEAFDTIDADGSGLLRRAELRRFLTGMSKMLPDRLISGLIDFCDNDGDAKTLSKEEFIRLMSADYLGKDGFDPNAQHLKQAERGATEM